LRRPHCLALRILVPFIPSKTHDRDWRSICPLSTDLPSSAPPSGSARVLPVYECSRQGIPDNPPPRASPPTPSFSIAPVPLEDAYGLLQLLGKKLLHTERRAGGFYAASMSTFCSSPGSVALFYFGVDKGLATFIATRCVFFFLSPCPAFGSLLSGAFS